MNNKFSFDEFLTEKSLMEKYQVSRAPVREALMQLRSDRIIASTPRHGYRIRKPAQEELRDIINFRTVMECFISNVTMVNERPGSGAAHSVSGI